MFHRENDDSSNVVAGLDQRGSGRSPGALIGLLLMVSVVVGCSAAASSAAATSTPSTLPDRTATPARPAPSIDQSLSPTPLALPALTQVFRSPLMGYSVMYPAGWGPHPATAPWLVGAANYWDDPVGDRLESKSAGFRGTSQPLAKGQTAAAWLQVYLASGPSCGESGQVPIGGKLGTIDMNGCVGMGRLGGRVFDLALVVEGRGYNFTMEGDVDRAIFLAMLATVRFDPGSAKDKP
jgi:hypothetical protein